MTLADRNRSSISLWPNLLFVGLVVVALLASANAKIRDKPYGVIDTKDLDHLLLPPPPSTHKSNGTRTAGRLSGEQLKLRADDDEDDTCKYDWCNAGEDKPICVVYFYNWHRAFTLKNQKCIDFNAKCVEHLGIMSWCHKGRCYDDSIKFCNPPD